MSRSSPGHRSLGWKAGAAAACWGGEGQTSPGRQGQAPAAQKMVILGTRILPFGIYTVQGCRGGWEELPPSAGAEQRDLLRALLAPPLCILWSKSLLLCYYEIGAVPVWGMLLLSRSLL